MEDGDQLTTVANHTPRKGG